MSIKQDIQRLNLDTDLVELYIIDATVLDDTIYYITPATISGSPTVDFNGITYYSIPMESAGYEFTDEGKMPRPKIIVANVNSNFLNAIMNYNDLVGAKVTRIRTFKKYLDGEAGADPTAEFPRDIFYIEQKVRQNAELIEWELVAAVDIEGVYLPKGQALSYCSHRYNHNASVGTCPYPSEGFENGFFDINGVTTTSGNDMCGKKLFDCLQRYNADADVLPFKGFPGMGTIGHPYN